MSSVFSLYLGILGGGFLVGSLVMVMEDGDAPHHLLLLRNFMSQGIVHGQSLLFAGPTTDPRSFLGTLPSPVVQKEGVKIKHDTPDVQDKVLIFCLFNFSSSIALSGLFSMHNLGLHLIGAYETTY